MIRFVATAWLRRGATEFEAEAALRIHAKAALATPAHPLHIYVLEGHDRLEVAYLTHLRGAHIHLHDASAVMAEIAAEYAGLHGIASAGNVRRFIRWMVMERLCPGERLLHLDLDLFFRRNFDEVREIVACCEGTVSGSPCITIATPEWLRIYREMVKRLISDRQSLETELGYGGNDHRRHIASDQDLIMALDQRGGILPQSAKGLEDWAIFPNPLRAPHAVGRPTRYRPGDFFGDRPVLFWHLQTNFASYLTRLALIQAFPHPWQTADNRIRLSFPDFRIRPSAEEAAFHLLESQARDRLERYWHEETALSMPHSGNAFELIHTRAWIANAFIIEGRLREIFSRDLWWDEEGFVEAETIAGTSPVPVGQDEKRADLQSKPVWPANVVIKGEIKGNTVIVEPSDRHTNLVIDLRGSGNTVIVHRLCALDAVLVAADGAHIEIGESTTMHGVHILAEEGSRCTVGARCQFANDVMIQASDPFRLFDRQTGKRVNDPRAVRIGDDVWLGERVHIAKGCVIGQGTVIEAASLLNGDYPGFAIIAGAPGKVTRTRIRWKPQAMIES